MPLNAIILYSELLQQEAADHSRVASIGDPQKIQSAGNQLLDLINGILDLSKIEAGKMTLSLERFDIRAMIDDLLDTVGPLAQQRGNRLTVTCGGGVETMTADLMKTRQILFNPLRNACKFTRAGSIALDVQRARAHAMANDRDLALAAGADDFDTKPVRFQQLLDRIDTLLKKAVATP